ncbi:hypothetical protein BC830DRAFT_120714 [Chytriomyces sp. MP71]|nr:hypothetical protein BC830DRAFT_120714 [Chytriomyces sp. MP71]
MDTPSGSDDGYAAVYSKQEPELLFIKAPDADCEITTAFTMQEMDKMRSTMEALCISSEAAIPSSSDSELAFQLTSPLFPSNDMGSLNNEMPFRSRKPESAEQYIQCEPKEYFDYYQGIYVAIDESGLNGPSPESTLSGNQSPPESCDTSSDSVNMPSTKSSIRLSVSDVRRLISRESLENLNATTRSQSEPEASGLQVDSQSPIFSDRGGQRRLTSRDLNAKFRSEDGIDDSSALSSYGDTSFARQTSECEEYPDSDIDSQGSASSITQPLRRSSLTRKDSLDRGFFVGGDSRRNSSGEFAYASPYPSLPRKPGSRHPLGEQPLINQDVPQMDLEDLSNVLTPSETSPSRRPSLKGILKPPTKLGSFRSSTFSLSSNSSSLANLDSMMELNVNPVTFERKPSNRGKGVNGLKLLFAK